MCSRPRPGLQQGHPQQQVAEKPQQRQQEGLLPGQRQGQQGLGQGQQEGLLPGQGRGSSRGWGSREASARAGTTTSSHCRRQEAALAAVDAALHVAELAVRALERRGDAAAAMAVVVAARRATEAARRAETTAMALPAEAREAARRAAQPAAAAPVAAGPAAGPAAAARPEPAMAAAGADAPLKQEVEELERALEEAFEGRVPGLAGEEEVGEEEDEVQQQLPPPLLLAAPAAPARAAEREGAGPAGQAHGAGAAGGAAAAAAEGRSAEEAAEPTWKYLPAFDLFVHSNSHCLAHVNMCEGDPEFASVEEIATACTCTSGC